MKKRVLIFMMVLALCLSLCACSSGSDPSGNGDGSTNSFTTMTHQIAGGSSACAVINEDGTVSCSLDTSKNQYVVVNDEWKSWTDVVDISMNEEILAAVKADGSVVWCGGRKTDYPWLQDSKIMGVVDSWKSAVQVSASHHTIAAIMGDGSLGVAGSVQTADLEEKDGFTQVSIYDALLCLRQDGTVYLYAPWKYDGQTWDYDVSGWTDITQVSAGFDHAVGLRNDGKVVATGNNAGGQCDVSEWTDIVQVCAGCEYTLGLKSDGTMVYCGQGLYDEEKTALSTWTDLVEISGFFHNIMGRKADGSLVYAGLSNSLNPVK